MAYLPEQLTEDEIRQIVLDTKAELGIEGGHEQYGQTYGRCHAEGKRRGRRRNCKRNCTERSLIL